MSETFPNSYWNPYFQFLTKVKAEHPLLVVCSGVARLTTKEILTMRQAIPFEIGTSRYAKTLQNVTNELLHLASLRVSTIQARHIVHCLQQLSILCGCYYVKRDFCSTGGPHLLAAFLDHKDKMVRSLALDLTASITCKNRYFQDSFVLAHFLPLLMRLAGYSKCDTTREKSLKAVFCLCVKNNRVLELFCESGGTHFLLFISRSPQLSVTACMMLTIVLINFPQFAQRAYDDSAVELLLNLACSARDQLLQQVAVDAAFLIVGLCSEADNTLKITESAARKLKILSDRFDEQTAARNLAISLFDVVKRSGKPQQEEE